MVNSETDVLPALQYNIDILCGQMPKRGAVAAFEPVNSRDIQASIKAGERIPVGAFSHGKLFSLENTDASDLKKARFGLARIAYITEVLEQLNGKDDEESLAIQLLRLQVDSAYASAVMVESARQYYEKKTAGTLGESEAQWLKDLLNEAQDAISPAVDTKLAAMALERIHGQEPREQLLSLEAREAWGRFLHEKYDASFDAIYEQFNDDSQINGRRLADMTAAFMTTSGLAMTNPAVATSEKGLDETKWTVIYDPTLSSFNVVANTKIIRTGDRDAPLDKLGFEKLMMHEVLVHAWRGENGSRTGHKALQVGLPGYIEAEEGLGILMESLWSGEAPDVISRDHFRYAAVAFASGTYDEKLHSEQETYEFTKKLMDGADVHDDAELYRHVMRVFRGMPDGCRMRSNAAYFAGKITMMQYIEDRYSAGDSIEGIFRYLQSGKFNPTDRLHARLVTGVYAMQG